MALFQSIFSRDLDVYTQKRGIDVTETPGKKKEVAEILQWFVFLHASGGQIIKHPVLPGKRSKSTNFEVTWYLVLSNSEPFSNFPFLPEDYIPHMQIYVSKASHIAHVLLVIIMARFLSSLEFHNNSSMQVFHVD